MIDVNSTSFWISNILAFFCGYWIGHLIFAKLIIVFLHIPVDKYYSKNLGATNVARIGGTPLGFATFLFDMTKTFLVCFLFLLFKLETSFFGSTFILIAGSGVFFGHCLPMLFRFKGGKGLSCIAGLVIVYNPYLGALMILLYVTFSLFFKNSIIAMILTMIAVIWCVFLPNIFPFYLQKFYHPADLSNINAYFLCACCGFSLIFHRSNFLQLLKNPRNPIVNPLYYEGLIKKIRNKTAKKNRN